MQNLDEKRWGAITMKSVFSSINISRAIDYGKTEVGENVFIGRQSTNNGVQGFVSNQPSEKGNCLSVGMVGQSKAFYQMTNFVSSQNILVLRNKYMTKFNGIFVATCIDKLLPKYEYGRPVGLGRIKRDNIMLPMNDSNEPDYDYMEQYTRKKHEAMLAKYRIYIQARISELGETVDIPALDEKEWRPVVIPNLFTSLVSGKSKGLNHLLKTDSDGINYIGATNRNNGVLCYVMDDDVAKGMVLPGNCIGFIKNGDGSAGYAIYKAESFVSTSDVIYGYASWLNKFIGLFFVAAQDMIKHKYSHGYKRNRQHLEGDRVMLPVNDTGEPDYAYMEQYAKNMMLKKYKQYLAFLAMKESHAQKHSRIKTCNVS